MRLADRKYYISRKTGLQEKSYRYEIRVNYTEFREVM